MDPTCPPMPATAAASGGGAVAEEGGAWPPTAAAPAGLELLATGRVVAAAEPEPAADVGIMARDSAAVRVGESAPPLERRSPSTSAVAACALPVAPPSAAAGAPATAAAAAAGLDVE